MDTVVVSSKQAFCWLRISKLERENSLSGESSNSSEAHFEISHSGKSFEISHSGKSGSTERDYRVPLFRFFWHCETFSEKTQRTPLIF